MMSACTVLSNRKSDSLKNNLRNRQLGLFLETNNFQLKIIEKLKLKNQDIKLFSVEKVRENRLNANNTLVFSKNFPAVCYEIKSHIQNAQSGGVFAANEYCVRDKINLDFQRKVAIKILYRRDYIPSASKEVELTETMFKQEAEGHKNVLVFDDYWIDNKTVYVVTPFAEYEDLFEVMKRRQYPFLEEELRWLFKQILDGADFLEGRGIAFRDHSLENILIFYDQEKDLIIPKINDPEQATRLSYKPDGNIEEIPVQYLFGKTFRPPEIYGVNAKYNPMKADVFCLGWVLFYLASRVQPFSTATKTDPLWQLIAANRFNDLLNKLHVGHLSSDLKNLLYHMLDPNMRKRYTIKECLKHPWFTHENTPINRERLFGLYNINFSAINSLQSNQSKLTEETFQKNKEEFKKKQLYNNAQKSQVIITTKTSAGTNNIKMQKMESNKMFSKTSTEISKSEHNMSQNNIYVSSAVSPNIAKHNVYLKKSLISLMNKSRQKRDNKQILEEKKTPRRCLTAPHAEGTQMDYAELSKTKVSLNQLKKTSVKPFTSVVAADLDLTLCKKSVAETFYKKEKDLINTKLILKKIPFKNNGFEQIQEKAPLAVIESTEISTTETLDNGTFLSVVGKPTIFSSSNVEKEEIFEKNLFPLDTEKFAYDLPSNIITTKPLVRKQRSKTSKNTSVCVRCIPRSKPLDNFVVTNARIAMASNLINVKKKTCLSHDFKATNSNQELHVNTEKSNMPESISSNNIVGKQSSKEEHEQLVVQRSETLQDESGSKDFPKTHRNNLIEAWENRIAENSAKNSMSRSYTRGSSTEKLQNQLNATERIAQLKNQQPDQLQQILFRNESTKKKPCSLNLDLPACKLMQDRKKGDLVKFETLAAEMSKPGVVKKKALKMQSENLSCEDKENLTFMSPSFLNRSQSHFCSELSTQTKSRVELLKNERFNSYDSETTEWLMPMFAKEEEQTSDCFFSSDETLTESTKHATQTTYLSECEQITEEVWPEEITGFERSLDVQSGSKSRKKWLLPHKTGYKPTEYYNSYKKNNKETKNRLNQNVKPFKVSDSLSDYSTGSSGISDDSVIAW